jgi:hypothetical protein
VEWIGPHKEGYEYVPDCLEDITPAWIEWALKKNKIIGENINISNVTTTGLTNDAGGEGGGGMTDAQLVRFSLDYTESSFVTGNEPRNLVGKVLLRITMFESLSLSNRILLNWLVGIHGNITEEEFWRREANFCREVIPWVENKFSYPKVYYTGINDVIDRNQFSAVILKKPAKLKSIILMEDKTGWMSQTVISNILSGGLSKDYVESMVRNIAVLHAKFWEKTEKLSCKGLQTPSGSEIWCRPSVHSWYMMRKRNRFISSISNCQRDLQKFIDQWSNHEWFSIHKNVRNDPWITTDTLPDGCRAILKDPIVLEMLHVFGKRYPQFNIDVASVYLKKPMQTFLHGDFHAGNHLYGLRENQGKVIVMDFQHSGVGRAVSDLVQYYVMFTTGFYSIDELLELIKIYHSALVKNGVLDYTWDELKYDLIVGSLEYLVKLFIDFSDRSPEKFLKLLKLFGDKFLNMKEWLDNGLFCFPIMFLVKLYLRDKENFLISGKFLLNL